MNDTPAKALFDAAPARPALVIAELGTSHGGNLAKGRELVAAACEAGADIVKFQHVYADEIIHPATGFVPLPGGPVALYERFRALETGPGFLGTMKEAVEAGGARFLCTPFGAQSARELAELGVDMLKVASPELNHAPLLRQLAGLGLPTILSTGVSTLADIEAAVNLFRDSGYRAPDGSCGRLALLHCVTSYPAPEEDYNLKLLAQLSALFGLPVGVSDHSRHPTLVPTLAAALGAWAVEKHFCLSRDDDGLDDPIALPPADFAAMAEAVREAALDRLGALAALERQFSQDRVRAVIGHGRKALADSERANYGRTNRSMHARRPIRRGETLSADNVAILRTEKVLRPGLSPWLLEAVLGRVAARDIEDGQGIGWEDIGGMEGNQTTETQRHCFSLL